MTDAAVESARQDLKYAATRLRASLTDLKQAGEAIDKDPHDLKLRFQFDAKQDAAERSHELYETALNDWRNRMASRQIAANAARVSNSPLDRNLPAPPELALPKPAIRAIEDRFPASEVARVEARLKGAEVITVEKELARARGELEQLEGRRRLLDHRTSLSTVDDPGTGARSLRRAAGAGIVALRTVGRRLERLGRSTAAIRRSGFAGPRGRRSLGGRGGRGVHAGLARLAPARAPWHVAPAA